MQKLPNDSHSQQTTNTQPQVVTDGLTPSTNLSTINKSQTYNPLVKIDKLLLSGGGMRGCIHIGVIRYLEERNLIDQIKHIAGTSIGALIATLLVMSYSSDDMEQMIKEFDYNRYQSVDVCHIIEHFGIDTFEKITGLIASLFTKKNYTPYVTFGELYKKTNKHLIINAVCLNTHESSFFDYIITPNMPVIIAIRASMSLPFIFGSVNYNGLTYVDGGLLNNFPVNLPIFRENPETVLGINLNNSIEYSVKEINSIDQYSIHLFSCLYNAYIKLATDTDSKAHIIAIPTPKFNTFDFLITTEDKKQLIEIGYHKIRDYCEKINSPKQSPTDLKTFLRQIKELLNSGDIPHALEMIDTMNKNHCDNDIKPLNTRSLQDT